MKHRKVLFICHMILQMNIYFTQKSSSAFSFKYLVVLLDYLLLNLIVKNYIFI